MCASTFSTACLHVDQGPITAPGLEPIGDLHRAGGLGQALGEGVVDPVLTAISGSCLSLDSDTVPSSHLII
jgi:hypothetical protein